MNNSPMEGYYCEDQLGSLIGVVDENGHKKYEYDYTEYGTPLRREVTLHIPRRWISVITPVAGGTRITLDNGAPTLFAGIYINYEISASAPDTTGTGDFRMGRISANTSNTITFEDPASAIKGLLEGAGNGVIGMTIWNAKATGDTETPRLSGVWSNVVWTDAAPVDKYGSTTFTVSTGGVFSSLITGWYIVPDVRNPVPMRILWAYGNDLAVSGDASNMASIGDTFLIYPPEGISKFDNKVNFGDDAPRYLFAGYRYMPSVGGALATETSGTYYCWNRIYDPTIGRWTTPDPAQSPVWNLYDYVGQDPAGSADSKGLYQKDVHFNMVFALASMTCLGDDDAEAAYQVAWASQYVDDNPDTTSYRPSFWNLLMLIDFWKWDARGTFHFPTSRNAVRGACASAADRCDTMTFGILLHTLADSYSHEGFERLFGHASAGEDPDHPQKDLARAENMFLDVCELMNRLQGTCCDEKTPLDCKVLWDTTFRDAFKGETADERAGNIEKAMEDRWLKLRKAHMELPRGRSPARAKSACKLRGALAAKNRRYKPHGAYRKEFEKKAKEIDDAYGKVWGRGPML